MRRPIRFVAAAAVMLAVSACTTADSAVSSEKPVEVQPIEGTDISRIRLTAAAAERLDIRTTAVESAGDRLVVPSAAVIIDPQGSYWVYTSPEPLVYVRQELIRVREEAQQAFFVTGPAPGTPVVTIGVPELYGAEFGIGK